MISDIYKQRFSNVKERDKLWKVLVSEFFQKFIKETDVVLDVPCGYAEFINNVKCRVKFALDLNADSKKHVAKNVKIFTASSSKIPLPDDSIDKIFVSNFFEHISKEDIILTVKEFKRILKKGGLVLVLQPNIRFCAKDYWMFFDHITPIDDRALTETFSIYGFKMVKKIEKFLPYTTKSILPKTDLFVKLYLKLPVLWWFFGKQSFLLYKK